MGLFWQKKWEAHLSRKSEVGWTKPLYRTGPPAPPVDSPDPRAPPSPPPRPGGTGSLGFGVFLLVAQLFKFSFN